MLAGGEGSRLKDLTAWRAKPAVPIGGKYRIIDFPLSNCVNSGIRRIGVLTQYKSHSLIRHLQRAWGFMRAEIGEFVEILPAQQRTNKKEWYQGTADALFQNLDIMQRHHPEYVLVLGGDHVYTMDYSDMLLYHAQSGADFTVGSIEVPAEEARGFGVMSVDEDMRITHFTEKPDNPDCIPGKPGIALVSMGIYIFSKDFLYKTLIDDAVQCRVFARFRQGHHSRQHCGRACDGLSLPQQGRRAGLLARCGDPVFLLADQHGIVLGGTRAQSVRP